MQVTIDQLRALTERIPFVRLLGLQVVNIGEGTCRVRLPFHEQLVQYYGSIHGGVIAALVDSTVYLAQTTLNGITRNTVTIEMKVNFLTSAKQGDLYADGHILKNGNKIIYGEVSVTNLEGKLIAHATVTYLRLDYELTGKRSSDGLASQ